MCSIGLLGTCSVLGSEPGIGNGAVPRSPPQPPAVPSSPELTVRIKLFTARLLHARLGLIPAF